MFKKFYPDFYMDSVMDVPFEELRKAGYRGIIFDIDNTLVEHGAPPTPDNIVFFKRLKELGYEVLFLSNNKEPRVKGFRDGVDFGQYIYKAGKPSIKNYLKAMEMMHTTTKDTFFVGDQLFTDVWGAKKAGIRTYLTKPIDPKEEIQIVLKRILERPVLWSYKRKKVQNGSKR